MLAFSRCEMAISESRATLSKCLSDVTTGLARGTLEAVVQSSKIPTRGTAHRALRDHPEHQYHKCLKAGWSTPGIN